MNKNVKLTKIGASRSSEQLLQEDKSPFDKPVQVQVKLVSLGQNYPKDIENVTLTLGNIEEGWQVFESLTKLVWKEVGSNSKPVAKFP